jgi:anaerobic magnesium-protoporphyrin IX monomethyl ester cyclase
VRVAFLNPPSPSGATFQKEIHRCGDRTHAGELWPPTGLATLAALARRAGWDADVFDGMLSPGEVEGFIEAVTRTAPTLLLLLTSTPTVIDDLAIARVVSARTGAPLVALGTHVSARPAEALARGAHAVLVGEPEGPLEALLAASEFHPRAWAGLPGVATAAAVACAPGEAYDLARLPLPARDLLDNARYTMPFTEGRPFATVQVMRGCPYGCSFCRTPAFSGRQTRMRPVDAVLEELHDLVARGIRDVAFLADTFTVRREYTVALCDALAGLGLRWYCTTRVDRVDEDLCRRMARAGCAAVAFGIESPDAWTLARVGKEFAATTEVVVRGAIEAARAAGIQTLGYFILGFPWEDASALWATARYARGLPLDHAFFHVATPFPGTALFDECLEQGYLTTTDWRRYGESSLPVIHTGRLAPETVLAARQTAQLAFYAHPARLARELARTRDLASLGRKLRAASALLRPAW